MKAVGIIAEYNPFHSGHKYLIDTASALTKADVSVSIMSGNFVQRGWPAYFLKWDRAETAVKGGVDLVIEMPVLYATANAGIFAYNGVRYLSEILECDYLAFGSETGDIDKLKEMASVIDECETEYTSEIKKNMENGISYPEARAQVILEKYPGVDDDILKGSNDVLALEYIRAIKKNGFNIEPIVIKREGDSHFETASSIREELKNSPDTSSAINKMEKRYFDTIKISCLYLTPEEIDEMDGVASGIGNKIKKEIANANSVEELIKRVKPRGFTYTRISRLLLMIALRLKKSEQEREYSYIRPLAMNSKGGEYLKSIKKEKDIITIDDVAKTMEYGDEFTKEGLSKDILSSAIYGIITDRENKEYSDYINKVRVLHE